MQLAFILVSQKNYQEALTQLEQLKKMNPEQAEHYFPALAYGNLETGKPAEARKAAELAKKWAKTQVETDQADSMLRHLDTQQEAVTHRASAPRPAPVAQPAPVSRQDAPAAEPEAPPPAKQFTRREDQLSRVEGLAQKLDCNGASTLLPVLVGQRIMVFQITDPAQVSIKHAGEAHHDFTRDPQKPFHVAVEYAATTDPKTGVAGIVRTLEF